MSTPNHRLTMEGNGSTLYGFLEMTGQLLPAVPEMDRVIRTGVNGIGIWYTGSRGKPFTVQTMVDAANTSAAGSLMTAYRATVGTKKDLYYCGNFWGTVLVHDVQLGSIRATGRLVGGVNVLSAAAGAVLRVSWMLETLY